MQKGRRKNKNAEKEKSIIIPPIFTHFHACDLIISYVFEK